MVCYIKCKNFEPKDMQTIIAMAALTIVSQQQKVKLKDRNISK